MRTTVFTCSIYPDLTRVWYHFVQRHIDRAQATTLIYDCGSRLDPRHFPGARIVRHRNVDHGQKIDHCIREHVRTPLLFLSDDDVFVLSARAEPLAAETLLAGERAAAFSFKPRGWWELEIDGRRHPVMGSYAVALKVDVLRRESLSFRVKRTADAAIRRGTGYYDTADYVNEQLLRARYEVIVPDPDLQASMVRSYSAVSSGFVAFSRRRFLRNGYVLSRPRSHWSAQIAGNLRTLEWACGVTATIDLHRQLFAEPPRFTDFFSYDDLSQLANQPEDHEIRQQAVQMVAGYRHLLNTLRQAA